MNFLAHDVVLPVDAPGVLRVAAAVPDLWSELPKRPLPVTIRASTSVSPDPAVRAVGDGISAHLRADVVFHRHPTFLRRLEWLEGEMEEIWPSLGSAELGAHVMVEMLLDRWLLLKDPSLAERYYTSFGPSHIAFVSAHAATDPESQKVLARTLEVFTSSRFLADYADSELLVMRFTRRLARVRFASANDPPIDRLVSRIDSWEHTFEAGSTELLDAVRRAVHDVLELR